MTEAPPRPTVAVLDYGSGNVHSAVKALIAPLLQPNSGALQLIRAA